jgi:hypothetical protein
MADETKQIEIGRYGAGTLSLFSSEAGQFILLGSMTIARRSEETRAWVALAPGWKVTAEGVDAVRVQLNDEAGVVVSFPGLEHQSGDQGR